MSRKTRFFAKRGPFVNDIPVSHEGRLLSIQILRALAASMVVFHHSWLAIRSFDSYTEASPESWQVWCSAGVDLFFLISGYIFYRIMAARPFNIQAFVSSRFWRIYPNYWIFSGLALTAYCLNPAWNLGQNALTWGTILQSFLIIPQAVSPVLPVGWTLEREMVFYSIFGLVNWLLQKTLLVPLLMICGTVGLLSHLTGYSVWNFHLFSLYQWEFAAGVWIASHQQSLVRVGWKVALLAALCLLVGARWLLPMLALTPWSEPLRVVSLVVVFGALMVAALALEDALSMQRRLVRWGVAIGEASYSLYLSHWFILSIMGKVVSHTALVHSAEARIMYQWTAIATAIVFALGYYTWIETRLLRLKGYFAGLRGKKYVLSSTASS